MAGNHRKTRWNMGAFRKIRTMDSTTRMLADLAEVGAEAGREGFIARSNRGRNRSRAAVIAATIEARARNARDHTLVGPVIDAMKAHGRK